MGVVLGLQQAGDDERLVPAQDRGLGFDVGPLRGQSRPLRRRAGWEPLAGLDWAWQHTRSVTKGRVR